MSCTVAVQLVTKHATTLFYFLEYIDKVSYVGGGREKGPHGPTKDILNRYICTCTMFIYTCSRHTCTYFLTYMYLHTPYNGFVLGEGGGHIFLPYYILYTMTLCPHKMIGVSHMCCLFGITPALCVGWDKSANVRTVYMYMYIDLQCVVLHNVVKVTAR